ncbi:hypothetical protein [Ideonella sp. YS5]|uniref:hypothetical protein n=1 Tax=Ideonella sp. YS5 TaxID=3453714 RepID=UPI003EE9AC39
MSKDQVLKQAEALVKDILRKDFNQRPTAAMVREVAAKVAKTIPQPHPEPKR